MHRHMFGEDHESPWDAVNDVKNRAKHYNKEPLAIDVEDESCWAIDRAIKNYVLDKGVYHPRTQEVDRSHKSHLSSKK